MRSVRYRAGHQSGVRISDVVFRTSAIRYISVRPSSALFFHEDPGYALTGGSDVEAKACKSGKWNWHPLSMDAPRHATGITILNRAANALLMVSAFFSVMPQR